MVAALFEGPISSINKVLLAALSANRQHHHCNKSAVSIPWHPRMELYRSTTANLGSRSSNDFLAWAIWGETPAIQSKLKPRSEPNNSHISTQEIVCFHERSQPCRQVRV